MEIKNAAEKESRRERGRERERERERERVGTSGSSRIPGYSPSVENNAAFASLRPPRRADELPWKLRSNIYPFPSAGASTLSFHPPAFVWPRVSAADVYARIGKLCGRNPLLVVVRSFRICLILWCSYVSLQRTKRFSTRQRDAEQSFVARYYRLFGFLKFCEIIEPKRAQEWRRMTTKSAILNIS